MTVNAARSDAAGLAGWRAPLATASRERQLADAYLQKALLQPRVLDQTESSDGLTIHYAAGADVVILFADPAGHAQAGPGRAIGYGEIFRADPFERKVQIAAAIARHIWFDQHNGPLVLPPAVVGQLDRVLKKLLGDFTAGSRNFSERPSHKAIVEALRRHGDVPLEEDLELLRKAFLLAGPAAEINKIRELAEFGSLVSAALIPLPTTVPAGLRNAIALPLSHDESKMLLESTGTWVDGLVGVQWTGTQEQAAMPDRSARNLQEAAQTMAWLEVVNRRLKSDNERLLYISGNTAIRAFGETYKPDWLGDCFSNAFLRHPRAFLSEVGLPKIDPPTKTRQTLSDLLTVWLGHFKNSEDEERYFKVEGGARVLISPAGRQSVIDLEQADPEGEQKISQQWSQWIKSLSRELPPPGYVTQLELAAKESPGSLREQLDKLRPQIEASFEEAFDELFESVVITRLVLEFPGRPPARERPTLCLEDRASCVTAFIALADERWRRRQSLSASDYLKYRKRVRDEGREKAENDDDARQHAGYFLNLTNAWLLAAQGHWKSASIIAARAIAAIPAGAISPLDPVKPNGREANYLLAVCRRHEAEKSSDLDQAEVSLENFQRIADRERPGASDPDWLPDIVPDRILAERLAIEVARIMFDLDDSPLTDRPLLSTRMINLSERFRYELIAPLDADLRSRGTHEADLAAARGSIPRDIPDLSTRRDLRAQLIRRAWRHVIGLEFSMPYGEANAILSYWRTLHAGEDSVRPPQATWRTGWVGPSDEMPPSGQGELQEFCCLAMFGRSGSQRRPADKVRESAWAELEALRPALAGRAEGKPTTSAFDLTRLIVHRTDAKRFLDWINFVERNR